MIETGRLPRPVFLLDKLSEILERATNPQRACGFSIKLGQGYDIIGQGNARIQLKSTFAT
jgi:hypothetical protein